MITEAKNGPIAGAPNNLGTLQALSDCGYMSINLPVVPVSLVHNGMLKRAGASADNFMMRASQAASYLADVANGVGPATEIQDARTKIAEARNDAAVFLQLIATLKQTYRG